MVEHVVAFFVVFGCFCDTNSCAGVVYRYIGIQAGDNIFLISLLFFLD